MATGAAYWIEKLGLRQHPEGGYFREMYRSEEEIPQCALPQRYGGKRCFSTAIYFLLTSDEYSAFHRLHSDELWFFHTGAPIDIYILCPDGTLTQKKLGVSLEEGHSPMCLLEAGKWFGAEVGAPHAFSLMSCVVAPGFTFEDFEMAEKEELMAEYPQHRHLIQRLTAAH